MSKTLFQKIADREITGDIVYEDDQVLAFRDIRPAATMVGVTGLVDPDMLLEIEADEKVNPVEAMRQTYDKLESK